MKNLLFYGLLLVFGFLITGCASVQDGSLSSYETKSPKIQVDIYGERLGTVHFPVSCNEPARQYAVKGLALLHHMTYEGARDSFIAATQADADCAMGYWGQAMSFIHPLWSDQPSEALFAEGQALVARAKAVKTMADWERAYVSAAEAYYAGERQDSERTHLIDFEQAWHVVHQSYPDDAEAASFYALAHLAITDKDAQDFSNQLHAAEVVKKVLKRVPDHPGAHHYLIHAFDSPTLAVQAEDVARSYGAITSNVSHALHMPSHIFTRLGLWEDSIVMNQRAADASIEHLVDGAISLHYLHALDYLAYAHLQRADDQNAQQVLQTIRTLDQPVQTHIASAYAFAAVPARWVLERKQWSEAAALLPNSPNSFPWDQFPAMQAMTHFARALGAAHTGNEAVALEALDQLQQLHQQAGTYSLWAKQIEIQHLSASAWLTYHTGKLDEALQMMRHAAKLEAETEKHPVTPGAILPARELLADLYMELGQYKNAQAEYLTVLTRNPNRFNSLYGVAHAAELAGETDQAALYFNKLLDGVAEGADRQQLHQAKTFLDSND